MGPKPKFPSSKGKQPSSSSSKVATKLPTVSPSKQTEKGAQVVVKKIETTTLPAVDGAAPKSRADPPVDAPVDEKVPEELIEQLCSMIAFTTASEACGELLRKSEDIEGSGLLEQALEEEKAETFARENGQVILLYEMYNEPFDIKDGAISKEYIDEEYCLSDVMPSCAIHLSTYEKRDVFTQLEEGNRNTFLREDAKTIYGCETGKSYTVFVEQEAAQLARDQEMMRNVATTMEGAVDPNAPPVLEKDDGRAMETCSCIYGNPCVDEYGCRSWHERFAVATKNGWKGF